MPSGLIDINSQQLAQGISKQAAHMRYPGQCEDATNVSFNLADGGSKRPGSVFVAVLPNDNPSGGTDFTAGGVYRLHPINRDASEKYLAVYAAGVLRVFSTAGVEARVAGAGAGSAAYYGSNGATGDQLRFVSIADSTIIANTTVALETSVTPDYSVTSEWEDYDRMIAHTPTSTPFSTTVLAAGEESYHKTNKASSGEPAGYYQYSVSDNTFPTMQFPTVTKSPSDFSASTALGFKIIFQKRRDNFTSGTWTAATRRLVKTGNWTGYAHQPGDRVYISSGTGWGAGWYPIRAKISANELELESGSGSDGSDVAGDGIGQEYRVVFNGTGGTLPSMHDVAKFIQTKLQAAGARDALIEWTDTASGQGYFTITGPWRGSGASIPSVGTNPDAPGGGVYSLAQAGEVFYPGGTVYRTDGSGSGPRTLPIDQRWTRVAAPGDRDGAIDATTAPMKMIRVNTARSGTVTAISTGELITTGAAHGLVVGQRVVFAGTNSTPSFNGQYVVATTPTTTTLTVTQDVDASGPSVPNVTVAGTAGTFTAPAYFTYSLIEWKNRTSGSDQTNPSPAPFTAGLKISDIGFFRQRFMILAGEYVVMSATNDLFRLYLDDALNLVDSDPITASLSAERITIGEFMTPVRDTVLITTYAGQHFALGAAEALTPSTVSFTRAFALQTCHIRPVVLDPTVYLAATANGKSQLREGMFFEDAVPTDTADVSAHVAGSAGDAGLLPSNPQTIVAHSTTRQVFMIAPNSNKIFVYKSVYNGVRKDQSAWTKWELDSGVRICDIAVLDDDLYVLMEHQSQFILEKFPLFQPALGNYPYNLHIDRQMELTGSHSAGVTTWTLPGGLSDTTINSIVLRTGAQVAVLSAAGTTVTATGNYSSAPATLGRTYEYSITASEPFMRDRNGDAILSKVLGQRQFLVQHISSGQYSVVNTPKVGTAATYTMNPPSGSLIYTDQRMALAGGDMSQWTIKITSTAPTPTTVAAITHVGDWGIRFHKGGA